MGAPRPGPAAPITVLPMATLPPEPNLLTKPAHTEDVEDSAGLKSVSAALKAVTAHTLHLHRHSHSTCPQRAGCGGGVGHDLKPPVEARTHSSATADGRRGGAAAAGAALRASHCKVVSLTRRTEDSIGPSLMAP